MRTSACHTLSRKHSKCLLTGRQCQAVILKTESCNFLNQSHLKRKKGFEKEVLSSTSTNGAFPLVGWLHPGWGSCIIRLQKNKKQTNVKGYRTDLLTRMKKQEWDNFNLSCRNFLSKPLQATKGKGKFLSHHQVSNAVQQQLPKIRYGTKISCEVCWRGFHDNRQSASTWELISLTPAITSFSSTDILTCFEEPYMWIFLECSWWWRLGGHLRTLRFCVTPSTTLILTCGDPSVKKGKTARKGSKPTAGPYSPLGHPC